MLPALIAPGTSARGTSGEVTAASASSINNCSDTYQSRYDSRSVTYRVTPSANFMLRNTVDIVVTVNPTPNVTTASPTTICSATSTNIALNGNVSGATFSWTIGLITGGVGGAIPSNGTTIAQTLYNTGITSGTVTYIVTPTANSCTGNPTNIVVTVNPIPTVTTVSPTTICSGSPTSIALTSNIATTTFDWVIGTVTGGITGASASSGSAIAQTLTNPGTTAGTVTYIVTPTANLCPGTPMNIIVTVKALPAITGQPANTPSCEFGTVNFSVTATGTDLSYQWFVDKNTGTFVSILPTDGTYSGQTSSTLQIWSTIRTMNNYKYHVVVSGCPPPVTSNDAVLTVNTAPELTVHPVDFSRLSGGWWYHESSYRNRNICYMAVGG